jgi:ABC-type glycerol-3-phosphate transport system substrate-binding protein
VFGLAEPNWTPDTFVAGEAAFYLNHMGMWDLAWGAGYTDPGFDWDAATEPYFDGGSPHTQTGGCAFALASQSSHKDTAMKFLKYVLLDPEASWTLTSGLLAQIPLLKEGLKRARTDPAYSEFPNSVKQIGVYHAQNWPTEYPKTPATVEYWQLFQEIFVDLRVGAREPEAAIMELTDRVERELEIYRKIKPPK